MDPTDTNPAPDGIPKPERPIREVTVTELDRHASRVLDRVAGGELVVISKHRRPVAMLLPLVDAVTKLPPEYVLSRAAKRLATEFEARERRRWISKLEHGRWHAEVLDRR